MLQFCLMLTILFILLVDAANLSLNWNLRKTCFICRSVLLHKNLSVTPLGLLNVLNYITLLPLAVFLRVVCLLRCVLFTFVYSCLCAYCFVCVALLGAWFDDIAVPRLITTINYLRYGRICHILRAIVNRPNWFVSKCR